MRRSWCAAVVLAVLVPGGALLAQDEPKPEELRKLYHDTLGQLKDAQDRKAELAGQNQKLTAHVAELEKQLQAQGKQLQELRQEKESFLERTFFLRAYYAACEQLFASDTAIHARWDAFLAQQPSGSSDGLSQLIDPEWPLPSKG